MAMTLAVNITDTNKTVWWGHTPYIFGPGEIKPIPVELLQICAQHEEWKNWIKEHDPSAPDSPVETKPEASEPTPTEPEGTPPWEEEGWDALTCDITEIIAYANAHDLQIDLTDEFTARAIVDEHVEN